MKSSTLELLTRRGVLRGMLAGGVVSVGLPILDCVLNTNGSAFASTGGQVPLRFATWFWGLGFGEADWRPKGSGADYELPSSLAALQPLKSKLNLFSGGEVFLDGQPNNTHFSGVQGVMTGKAIGTGGDYTGSLDTIIGDVIGAGTRFRSLEVACDGDPRTSWSARANSGLNPAEVSPLALYKRIFGPEFKDPNSAEFVPDPQVMLRRSALSAVTDSRQQLMRELGTADRAKLDNYFTSLRALEQKLDIQLQRPLPMLACTKPAAPPPDKKQVLTLATDAMERHDLFASLLAHAMACGQTRVANLAITQGMSGLLREGDSTNHHTLTHEEPIDATTGYQIKCAWFQSLYMQGLHNFATAMDAIHEGDKTLLDRMVIFAYTDHGAPRLHSLRNMPVITIGSADGKLKTGLYVPRPGDATTRVSFTIQQAFGVPAGNWGLGSNRVSSPIAEVLA
jgi:hypothetical protein